jgi:hypothetical protein
MIRHNGTGASLLGDPLTNSSAPRACGTGGQHQESGFSVLLSRYDSTDWCARHGSAFFIGAHPPLPETDPVASLPVAS